MVMIAKLARRQAASAARALDAVSTTQPESPNTRASSALAVRSGSTTKTRPRGCSSIGPTRYDLY
jgi:hypothetical protein